MISRIKLFTSLGIFIGVYLVLILPVFGGSESYAEFYRKQGFRLYNNFGEKGFVVFEGHDDTGQDDTRIYQANKTLANEKKDVVSVPYNISTRILAYLPTALLISLFAATPIKIWKRLAYMLGGLFVLHIFLMLFLYILILDKFINTPILQMYQDMNPTLKSIISYLNSSINHGMGLNNFLVVLIWLSMIIYFERSMLAGILAQFERKTDR